MSKEQAKNKVRSFRMSDSIYEKLGEIAKANGVSKADVIFCFVSAYEQPKKNGEQYSLYDGFMDNTKLELYFDVCANK